MISNHKRREQTSMASYHRSAIGPSPDSSNPFHPFDATFRAWAAPFPLRLPLRQHHDVPRGRAVDRRGDGGVLCRGAPRPREASHAVWPVPGRARSQGAAPPLRRPGLRGTVARRVGVVAPRDPRHRRRLRVRPARGAQGGIGGAPKPRARRPPLARAVPHRAAARHPAGRAPRPPRHGPHRRPLLLGLSVPRGAEGPRGVVLRVPGRRCRDPRLHRGVPRAGRGGGARRGPGTGRRHRGDAGERAGSVPLRRRQDPNDVRRLPHARLVRLFQGLGQGHPLPRVPGEPAARRRDGHRRRGGARGDEEREVRRFRT